MTEHSLSILCKTLKRDEGVRLKPYRDGVGKLSIGTGRNLEDVGISEAENDYLLTNDIKRIAAQLNACCPWWRALDVVRQRVLVNMGFNLGIRALLIFHQTLEFIKTGHYTQAATAMLDSRWAQQVGQRAQRLSRAMQTGVAPLF